MDSQVLLYGARAPTNGGRRFRPRHFAKLVNAFAPKRVRWARRLADLPQGGWGLVIRAPGSYALGRDLARDHLSGAFVFDQLTVEERRALERRNGTLVIDLGWDPLLPNPSVVQGLIQSLEAFGLPSSRIRLLHSNQAARPAFETLWRQHSGEDPCASLEFPTSFALGLAYQHAHRNAGRLRRRLSEAKASLERGAKARRFNCFNGEFRPHRVHILASLHQAGLLDQGYVSLLGYNKTPADFVRARGEGRAAIPDDIRLALGKFPHAAEVAASVDALFAMTPLEVDLRIGRRFMGFERTAWSSQHHRYYDQSWFSAVIDSHSNRRDMLHITEKVMKPMLNGHPFLYLGSAGSLPQLRRYGFESFAPAFDESFDAEPLPHERMRLYVTELSRLASLSDADLAQICAELWPQCEHNHGCFWGEAFERLRTDFHADVLDRLA